ncbi:MAG: hypothetical protein WBE33_05495 [Planococcus citreus]
MRKSTVILFVSTIVLSTLPAFNILSDSEDFAAKARVPEPWSVEDQFAAKARVPEPWSVEDQFAAKARVPEPWSVNPKA